MQGALAGNPAQESGGVDAMCADGTTPGTGNLDEEMVGIDRPDPNVGRTAKADEHVASASATATVQPPRGAADEDAAERESAEVSARAHTSGTIKDAMEPNLETVRLPIELCRSIGHTF